MSLGFVSSLLLLGSGVQPQTEANVDPPLASPSTGDAKIANPAAPQIVQDILAKFEKIAADSGNASPTQSITIPKAHPILITVNGQVGSKISKAKEFFPIKLAQPVVIDGVEVLPAGITGEGQVVHAKKGGFAGSAGELILAARYLTHNGRKIPLRSFKWIEEGDEFLHRGQDNTVGAMAASAVALPLGLLIGGGNTTIEPGTAAKAKIKQEMTFELPVYLDPAPSVALEQKLVPADNLQSAKQTISSDDQMGENE